MIKPTLNVAVLGAGSIGCYVGGQLASAGASVRFIGRERFKRAIEENGLTLTHYVREVVKVPMENVSFDLDVRHIADVDVVLVTVKSQDTKAAGQELTKLLNKDAIVVSFQNGIGNADTLREVMPGYTVLGAMVPFNVTGTSPGRFHCGTEGDLWVEQHPASILLELQSMFQSIRQGCILSDDIKAVQWGKLLVNLNNAMNTLAGLPLKACLVQRDYRKALAFMIEEALGILKAANIKPAKFGKSTPAKMIKVLRLPNFLYQLIMNSIVKIDDDARSSMLDDLDAGRVSEIDYLQGEIVKLAQGRNQQAPINEIVMKLVQEAFTKGASPKMSGADLLNITKV
jgi:2-dehydropantoate 2-reductase